MVEHPIANLKELLVISMVGTQKTHQEIMKIAMEHRGMEHEQRSQ